MPINIIDPNNKRATDASGNSTFYGSGRFHKENSMPESENLYIYAELTATQYKESVYVSNDRLSEYNQTTPESVPINMIGHTQEGINKGRFEAFDGNWQRDGNFSDFNGFGIKSINIRNGLNFVTQVDITFLDARKGESLSSPPYGFLLSTFPSPIYTLKVKGYYGRAVAMKLLMSIIPKVSLQPDTGFMEIQCSFVSNTFKPLGSITMGDLFMLPFLKSNGNTKLIDLKATTPPKTFYEFILRTQSLYIDLVSLKETTIQEKKIAEIRSENPQLQAIIDYKNGYINQLPSPLLNNSAVTIVQDISQGKILYRITSANSISVSVSAQIRQDYVDFMSSISKNLTDAIGITDYSVLNPTATAGQNGTQVLTLDFGQYDSLVKARIASNDAEIARLEARIDNDVTNALEQRFGPGFKPTVRNIMRLICNDVDEYFNILRKANEDGYRYHSANTPLVDSGNGGVDVLQPFPTYSRKEFYGNTTPTLVRTWPSDQQNWPEYALTIDFFNAYIYRGLAERNGEEARKNRIDRITISGSDVARDAGAGQFDSVKHEIYYRLKSVVDMFIKPYRQDYIAYSYPNNDGMPLIDRFRFTDRAGNDIGDVMVLDFMFLSDLNLMGESVWGLISKLLNHNKITPFPIENFINYNIQDWSNAFEPYDLEDIPTSPSFYCMYIGGISSHNNSEVVDSFSFTGNNLPPDYAGLADVYGFKVGYGEQNQSYFKSVSVSSSEHNVTKESIMMADDISKRGGTAVPILQGQSLYNIFRTYSFKANVSMLGCMSIQPTQYFDLSNIPIFSGVHMVTEVSHSIQADSTMETSFKGIRVGRYVEPIMKDFAISVRRLLDGIPSSTAGIIPTDQFGVQPPSPLVRRSGNEYRKNITDPVLQDSEENYLDYYTSNPINPSLSATIATGLSQPYQFLPLGAPISTQSVFLPQSGIF